jgi:hypothetical protein
MSAIKNKFTRRLGKEQLVKSSAIGRARNLSQRAEFWQEKSQGERYGMRVVKGPREGTYLRLS